MPHATESMQFACPVCEYELHSLQAQTCPECGVSISADDAVIAWMKSLGVSFAPEFIGNSSHSFKIPPLELKGVLWWLPAEVWLIPIYVLLAFASFAGSFFIGPYGPFLLLLCASLLWLALKPYRSARILSYLASDQTFGIQRGFASKRHRSSIPLTDVYLCLHSSRQADFAGNGFGCTLVAGNQCLVICASDCAADIRLYLAELPDELRRRAVSTVPEFDTRAWGQD